MIELKEKEKNDFYPLWFSCDRYGAFSLAKSINPKLSQSDLEKSNQFLTIFAHDFETALDHFRMMVNNTY